jgi:hypothetical protein
MKNEIIDYWYGIEECVCDSQYPIGGCLKCDLVELQEELDKIEMAKVAIQKVLEYYPPRDKDLSKLKMCLEELKK